MLFVFSTGVKEYVSNSYEYECLSRGCYLYVRSSGSRWVLLITPFTEYSTYNKHNTLRQHYFLNEIGILAVQATKQIGSQIANLDQARIARISSSENNDSVKKSVGTDVISKTDTKTNQKSSAADVQVCFSYVI